MAAMIFEAFLGTPQALGWFDADAVVRAMLAFEAALARAQRDEGVIPAGAGDAIAAACEPEGFDVAAIVDAGARAGSVAIPFVKALTERVAQSDRDAAGYVHWGTTSQDAIDTAMALCARHSLAHVDATLAALTGALLDLAERHAATPLLARTLLQPAAVTSVRFKLCGWIAPLLRARARLHAAGTAALQLQLGGAVGTLAVMGACGPAVAMRVAHALRLRAPQAAWHTQRDEVAVLACELGVLVGSLGKIATDLALLAQGEVGEFAEPSGEGRGGSSAMPHKRNPVASMVARAAALRAPQRVAAVLAAMPQEHERGLGGWQAELAETVALHVAVHGALDALAAAAPGLRVDAARMRANIDAQRGLVYAEAVGALLGRAIGKRDAHARLERWTAAVAAGGAPLRDVVAAALRAEPQVFARVDPGALDAVFDADRCAAQADALAAPQLAALRDAAHALDAQAPWREPPTSPSSPSPHA